MIVIRRVVSAAMGIAFLAAFLVSPGSASAASVYYELYNSHAGKCLEIQDWSQSNGAVARLWDCTGGANQDFEYVGVGGDYYLMKNRHSGKCLEVPGGAWWDGAGLQQWDCNWGDNQRWAIEQLRWTHVFRNKYSGKYIEVSGWSDANGARIQQWTRNGGANQEWL
jgi:hypothetical protein